MVAFVVVLHIIACVIMIMVVLLQVGKGSNMGSFFGGSSQTIFGSSGPGTFLGKFTAGVAILFMLTSLLLSNPSFYKPRRMQQIPSADIFLPGQQQAIPITQNTPIEDGK